MKKLRIASCVCVTAAAQIACAQNADGTLNMNGDFATGFPIALGIVALFVFCIVLIAVCSRKPRNRWE